MTFSLEKVEVTKLSLEEPGAAKFPLVKGVRGIFECHKSKVLP
jgi:hypothetical protein